MKKLIRYFRNVPLRWRLTFSSSVLMFITFLVFSFVQYELLYNWLLSQEKEAVIKTKEEVAAYYEQANRPFQEINRNDMETLLLKLNDRHQLIRILDMNQDLMISVSNEFPKKLSIANYPSREGIEEIRVEGEHYIVTWVHIQTRSFQGTVEVVRNLTTFHEVTKIILWITIGFAIATMIISILSGILISRQYITPLKELNHAMIKIKDEGFQTRVKETQLHDEVTELTRIFNGMMDTVEDTINQQKQFIEDASHELRTPIAVLEGHLSMLNRWGKNDSEVLDESLQASMQEVTRLRKLVLELLELTRSEAILPSDIEPIEVSEIIEQLTKNVAVLHPDFHITFEDVTTGMLKVSISRHHLEQIIMILLDNAVKYSADAKYIQVLVSNKDENVIIEVKDAGIGIPSEDLGKVFNRFYRVDKARSREGGGTGLGLAIAKRLVEKYNGEIMVTSQEQQGTTFTIILKK
ncbi:sensor histidine kinase [Bacillus suaedaesalsae]|uniref:Signal transduction histidine-protein kinase ArlS n=1 Tax=Bacillus suaedaesalsae TaxID=2810349 RepID=A0ABS2DJV5_9BACI|nr:HAMP domain-containing histidine kinase [Bacillus suaedaesalsae]MBM6618787.1 GHKL domain-containing protein [Bacillus suaedaesalsae]